MKKKDIIITIILFGVFLSGMAQTNTNHPKGKKIAPLLESFTAHGLPGVGMAIMDKQGWWVGCAGYADLENKIALTESHLHYLQSVAKTYMAVAVLKLYEEDQLQLDDPITKYLSPNVSEMLDSADEITIKMLLNHTSGLPEYNFHPGYASTLLQYPETAFTPKDYINYIKGKPLNFEPGSKYSYRNTNYVLLSMIVDHVTGNHGVFMEDTIFKPLGLKHTYYQISEKKLKGETLTEGYWDRYSDGVLENISRTQRLNVTYMVGDDGIVTTTEEAVLFLKGLLEGELLKESTLDLMKTWVKDKQGKPRYGLGLGYGEIADHIFYGHSGGGLGAGCELRYFPEKNLYVFVAINIGTVTQSPLHEKLAEIRENLYQVVLEPIK